MKQLFCLFFCFAAHATVNEPLRWEIFSGYRNDRLHWHLQNPGSGGVVYSEMYRDVEFWENGLSLKTIHRDFAFYAKGSYSAFGKGRLSERYAGLAFTSNTPSFQANTTGWAADALGYVALAVNLTADRTYKWLFLPLFGYSAHFERLSRTQPKPSPATGSSYEMFSSFPSQLRQSWYGFFLGGSLQIEPTGRFLFNLGYAYHWVRTQFNTQWKTKVLLFDNGSLVSDTATPYSLHINQGGNLGQTGWAQIDYRLSKAWRIGLGAQLHYFSTTVMTVKMRQGNESISQKFKLRWTPIDGWLQASREF